MIYFAPAFFRGFFRGDVIQKVPYGRTEEWSAGFAQDIADHHNSLTATVLRAHPSSAGTVRLTGSHPQDVLDIQKNHFQGEEGRKDVIDLREGIKTARRIVGQITDLYLGEEVFPGANATSDQAIEDHIYKNIFGQ